MFVESMILSVEIDFSSVEVLILFVGFDFFCVEMPFSCVEIQILFVEMGFKNERILVFLLNSIHTGEIVLSQTKNEKFFINYFS